MLSLVIQFIIIPDTEGHTLEEIETYFSDKTRRICDTRIRRNVVTGEAPLVLIGSQGADAADLEFNGSDSSEITSRRRKSQANTEHVE